MEREGIETRHALVLKERRSAAYTIHREEGGTRRAVEYQDRGPESAMCQLLEPGPHAELVKRALVDVGERADILVITGIGASRARSAHAFGKLLDLALAVRRRGATVIVDFNHRFDPATGAAKLWMDDHGASLPAEFIRQRMDRLFAVANLVFIAHDELWPIYGGVYQPSLGHGQEAIEATPIVGYLQELKCPSGGRAMRAVFFKRGKNGGTLYHCDEHGQERVFHTDRGRAVTRDRNGGGDALIGGALAGLLTGFALEQALNFGQHLAGQVIQHLGGVIRRDYLPDNGALDLLTRKAFRDNQFALMEALAAAPFVAVFQLSTHDGKNTIADDAKRKVAAMYRGGMQTFEFLLRGDERIELDEYIAQTLTAIGSLATKYPMAKFGVGTVSCLEHLERVAENPHVAFIVTAHWPGEEFIRTATGQGKPILPTVSHTERIELSSDGRIASPGKTGIDILDSGRIRTLHSLGVLAFKVFDFGSIARKRLETLRVPNAKDPALLTAAGLIAMAEAIRDSAGGDCLGEQRFFAMATGGVTLDNLPYLIGGIAGDGKERIRQLAGDSLAAHLIAILERTTVVAGGTFITREYDRAADAAYAGDELTKLSGQVTSMLNHHDGCAK